MFSLCSEDFRLKYYFGANIFCKEFINIVTHTGLEVQLIQMIILRYSKVLLACPYKDSQTFIALLCLSFDDSPI